VFLSHLLALEKTKDKILKEILKGKTKNKPGWPGAPSLPCPPGCPFSPGGPTLNQIN
jgi:hypothetical protein